MSEIYTLKQIQVDAARYRWLRENVETFFDATVIEGMGPYCLDNEIDKRLNDE